MAGNPIHSEYINTIMVAYGHKPSEAPPGRIREINGRNDDINAGFGGDYVWLIPGYSTSVLSALTGFDVFIQSEVDPGKQDLAKGAGGDFRYLIPLVDTHNYKKIYNVGLLRLQQPLDSIPDGYDGKTIDLNKGRGGDFLYVIWKSSRD